MYLPSGFIKEQLTRHGFFQEGDSLYVSGEVGEKKSTGDLFRYIHQQEGIDYKHWHHYGDNRNGDYRKPRQLGIHTHLMRYGYSKWEREWVSHIPTGRYPFPSLMAGISRAVRLGSTAAEAQVEMLCHLTAPVLVPWVVKILTNAQRNGIKRLYFFARDTHTEFLVARSLQRFFPAVEPHYLFVSSKSLYDESPLRLSYLEQEGVASLTDTVALVDSCSTGHSTQVINSLLTEAGYRPCYTYTIVHSNLYIAHPSALRYFHSEIDEFYTKAPSAILLHKIVHSRRWIEHLFCFNLHSRTVGYRVAGGRVRPIFQQHDSDDMHVPNFRQYKRQNDLLMRQYAEAFMVCGLEPQVDEVLHLIGLPTLGSYLQLPSQEHLSHLSHFSLQGKPFVARSLWQLLRRHYVWKRGSIVHILGPAGYLYVRWSESPIWAALQRRLKRLI